MLRATLLVLGCCLSAIATAADNGLYIGAGVAQSEYGLDNTGNDPSFDDKDDGYKAILGFRPLDHFGIEANYIDHGDATLPSGIACTQLFTTPCPDNMELSGETLSAFAVGYIDFPLIDLFAKAGMTSWQLDGHTTPSSAFTVDESGEEFAWGVGVQARFGSLGARLEYEDFGIAGNEHLGTISLSLTYTIL